MTETTYQALVVEDEPSVRRLTVRALAKEKILCHTAENGEEGMTLIDRHRYDLVVTDLRMPKMHGHALCQQVLARRHRPLLVVLTGVMEPRLARDLMARGIDEISFKPVDYGLFATKIRGLLDRRQKPPLPAAPAGDAGGRAMPDAPAQAPRGDENHRLRPVSGDDLASKLANLSGILPISQVALDVFALAGSTDTDAQELAAAVGRDASLVTDVLQLANCSVYNPSGKRVIELEEAVARIGQNRIRELALASSALTTVTAGMLSWMDVHLAWQRSVAAGVAAEILIVEGQHERIEDGVALGAIMHTLGRIVLGTLYPNEYSAMVEICKQDRVPLAGQEIRVFAASHASIMARVLSAWNIPSDIYLPLSHVLDSYQQVEDLPLPLKTQVQLVKLSMLIGRIAVGRWEPWDLVDIPPPGILEDLRIGNLADIVERTKGDLQDILAFRVRKRTSRGPERHGDAASSQAPVVTYCDLSGGPHDLLPLLLQGIGLRTIRNRAIDDCGEAERVVVDCRGSAPEKHPALDRLRNRDRLMILCDPTDIRGYQPIGRAVPVPCSFVTLAAACKEMFLAKEGNVPVL